jgi:anaerobic magnesium-protoporphyrin IX monomethyl ester cyclase
VIRLKVVLIFPNTRRHSLFYPSVTHEPLGLALLTAMIKNDHEVMVIDATAENLQFKKIIDRITKFNPDIIGITTNISIAYAACELALRIKLHSHGMRIIMGGPWATANYNFILKHKIGNYVALGEGEYTFKEFLHRLEQNIPIDDLEGFAFLNLEGEIVSNPMKHFIQDLDALPYPAWEYFPPSNKYFNNYRHLPLYPIMVTRGCPYGCIHCTKIIHGYQIRKRSVEHVIGEIKYLKEKFNVKEIIIIDDNFTQDVEYAESILDAIAKARLNIYILMPNGIRADTLNPQLLSKMKRAGVYGFSIGVESGVQHIVNRIGKKLDLQKVRYAAKLAKEFGFLWRAFFILGLPYDSLDTMRQSVQFAKEIDPDFAYFFIAKAFPGSKMYDMAREMGAVEHQTSDECKESSEEERVSKDPVFFSRPFINFSMGKLKPGDVKKAYNIAVREFYMRPKKILNLIKIIKSIPELKFHLQFFLVAMNNILNGFLHKENLDD